MHNFLDHYMDQCQFLMGYFSLGNEVLRHDFVKNAQLFYRI